VASVPLLKEWPEIRQVLLGGVLEEEPWMLALPCISCLAVGGTATGAVPVAAAAVALHRAARILDSVQDDDEVSTVEYGSPATAIGLATGLIFAAFHCLGLAGVDDRVTQRLLALFSHSTFRSSRGQYLGLFQDCADMKRAGPLEAYWYMVIAKSGSLFRMCAAGGAVVGTDSQHLVDALGEYGNCIGVMLQLIDDCRDVLEDLDSAGSRGSLPLALLSLIRKGEPDVTEIAPLDSPGFLTRQSMYDTLRVAGVLDVISDVLLEWQQRALNSLTVLRRSEAVDTLEYIARGILASHSQG
jgi:geranylgeranyl pyrophosphate synthase